MEDYRLEQSGQEVQDILNGAAMQTDLTAENDRAELAERTLQGNIDDEASTRENADIELQGHIDDEEIRAKAAEKQNADDIDAIEEKIPSGASSQNKLATAGELAAKQDALTFDNAPTPSSTNPVTSGGVYTAIDNEKGARINADAALQQSIEAILLLIPSAATALNQLADKSFVNSTVATASATFRGTYNLVSDLSLAVTATHAQIAAALAGAVSGADNNDYCFVQIPTSADTPTEIRVTERYKFNGETWAYEYDLNNSGFTAAQWEAINSAITSALVAKLSNLPDATQLATLFAGKQNTLTFDNAPASGSDNPVKSGGIYDAIAAITAVIPSAATSSNKLVDLNALTTYVTGIIGALDASFDLTSTDGHVTLKMTQVDGVITTLQILTSDIASSAALTMLGGQVSTNASDIAALQQLYNNLQQSDPIVIESTDTWPVANPSTHDIYRVIDRVNTPPQYYSDYMFKADDLTTPVLMAQYNNAIDPRPKKGSANLVTSGGVFDNMGALDVSELNATGVTLATYATLDAAIAAIPSDYQKGGMSIKFVSSVDNTYVQFRLTKNQWSTTPSDWQGVDDEPIDDSDNLVKSGGVASEFQKINGITFKDTWSSNKQFIANFEGGKTYIVSVSKTANVGIDCGYRNLPSESVTRIFMMSANETYKEQSVTFESDQKYLVVYSGGSAEIEVKILGEQSVPYQLAGKVNIEDIVDNLNSDAANKPLSAHQGKVLKGQVDGISDMVELVSSKNLFNKETVTDNMRQNWYNDSTAAVAGMCMSVHIPVTSGQSYVFSPIVGEVMARVFNAGGTGVQGVDATSTQTFVAHANASYMVVSCQMSIKDSFQVEKGTTPTSYEEYFEPHNEIKPECLPDMEEVNEVTVGVGGDYTTILEALKDTDDSIKVHVMRGTYDIIAEYQNLYGNDFWDTYPGYDNTTTDKFMYGLWVSNGRHLVFDAGAKVVFDYTGENSNVKNSFSVFATGYNAHIEGLNLVFNNSRYAIHDDFSAVDDQKHSGITIFERCTFDGNPNYSAMIGGGCGYNNTYIVKDCTFNVTSEANKNLVSYHNPRGSNALNRIVVENCVGNGSIAFNWYGTSTDITLCTVTNCKCRYISCAAHSSEPHDIVNMRMVEWNNITDMNIQPLW